IPLLLAGKALPYPSHEQYFAKQAAPRLSRKRRFIGPVGPWPKERLLAATRCLLAPSLAPETSSLVAREALACGTPVVAFPNGALPETVVDGDTGFLVGSVEEMAEAIERAQSLGSGRCRDVATERFSLETMTGRYIE